jgi:organic hydroperoxide reductase OsmC/OhrA
MTTFLAVAEISKLTVLSYRTKAVGRLEKTPEGYRFTEIIVEPEVSVPAGEEARALRLLAKAEGNCFVTKSLRATVRLEPRVLVQEIKAAT